MDFARSQLLKYGWEDGKGLGKNASGMSDPIKVKLKKDKTGIGHDVGKEFTNHWWDNVFNKTASSIQVTNTEDGVEIIKDSKHEKEISKNLQTYSKKAMAYGNFVRKATLSNGCENVEQHVTGDSSAEESDSVPTNFCLMPENEDEIFSKCGGRTAHKGARHGLKLNGKLQRIQEQEQLLLDKMKSKLIDQNEPAITSSLGPASNSDVIKDGKERKRKKKKKKSKQCDIDKDIDVNKTEMGGDGLVSKKRKRKLVEDCSNNDGMAEQTEYSVKSKKKYKQKDKEVENACVEKTDEEVNATHGGECDGIDNDTHMSVISKKKKKKKKQKNRNKE